MRRIHFFTGAHFLQNFAADGRSMSVHSKALLHTSSRLPDEPSQEDIKAAREWLERFERVPESLYDVTYSRSSGPGGQNVNKTNSKATLRVHLSSLLKGIPPMLHRHIRNSTFATAKSDMLVISSDDSRKQQENRRSCEMKLNEAVIQAAREAVPGETTEAQHQRVIDLQKTAQASRLRDKKGRSLKKSARRDGRSPRDY